MYRKIIPAFLISAILIFNSCSQSKPEEKSYTESVTFESDNITYRYYYTLSGDNFVTLDSNIEKDAYGFDYRTCELTVRNKGFTVKKNYSVDSDCYAFYTDAKGNYYLHLFTTNIIKVYDDSFNMLKEIEIKERVESFTSPQKLFCMYDQIYIVYSKGIHAIDSDGNTRFVYKSDIQIVDSDMDEKGDLYFLTNDNTSSKPQYRNKIDRKSGKLLWSIPSEERPANQRKVYINDLTDEIYIAYDYYILIYNQKGEYKARLIDFMEYDIIDLLLENKYMIGNLDVDNDGSIYLGIYNVNKSGFKLIKYEPADALLRRNRTTLTVVMPNMDKHDMERILKYQMNNKININVKSYGEPNSLLTSRNKEEYTQQINLMLMAGEEWDILATTYFGTNLPYKKYIKTGLFEDLNNIDKESLSNPELYFQNVFDAFREEGRMFIFPLSFSFKVCEINKIYIMNNDISLDFDTWSWDELMDSAGSGNIKLAVKNDGKIADIDEDYFLYNCFNYNINAALDYDNKTLNPGIISDVFNKMELLLNPAIYSTDRNALISSINNISLYSSDNKLSTVSLTQLADNSVSKLVTPVLLPKLSGDSKDNYFGINESYGINKDSKSKEEALKFLQYLAENSSRLTPSVTLLNKELSKLHETDYNLFLKIIESLNKVDYTDVELLDANDYKEYYNGNKTKEYMINIIEEKAWLYLNE